MILRGIFPLPLLMLPPALVLLPQALRMSTRMIPATIQSRRFLVFILFSPLLPCLVICVTRYCRQPIPATRRSSSDRGRYRHFASASLSFPASRTRPRPLVPLRGGTPSGDSLSPREVLSQIRLEKLLPHTGSCVREP